MPVPCYIGAGANPNRGFIRDIFEESSQRCQSSGSPDDSAVQTNAHHLPLFLVQGVKRIFQVSEELIARIKSLGGGESHVVVIEGVRHNQMFSFSGVVPVWKVVSI